MLGCTNNKRFDFKNPVLTLRLCHGEPSESMLSVYDKGKSGYWRWFLGIMLHEKIYKDSSSWGTPTCFEFILSYRGIIIVITNNKWRTYYIQEAPGKGCLIQEQTLMPIFTYRHTVSSAVASRAAGQTSDPLPKFWINCEQNDEASLSGSFLYRRSHCR
jgi:hypothetical protein